MKHIWMAVVLGICVPAALAGEGGPVPQVIETPAPALGPVFIPLQQSIPITLNDRIAGISVGSSRIADVTVHDGHTFLITGRAYGTTSLHIVDTLGNIVVDTTLHVVDASPNRLRVNRAGSDYSLDCTPDCQAAPNIGDETEYFQMIVEQAEALAQ